MDHESMEAENHANDWRTRLARALAQVWREQPQPQRAVGVLRRIPNPSLKRLARVLARDSRLHDVAPLPHELAADHSRHDEDGLLLVHACSVRADVRANALVAFRSFPRPLAMWAALACFDDRAEPVRHAANDLLCALIRDGYGALLFANLARIHSLRSRGKMSDPLWTSTVEPALLDLRYTSQRIYAARPLYAVDARLFALQLAVAAHPDDLRDLLVRAAEYEEPIARWALGYATTTANAVKICTAALKNELPSIRAEALQRLAALRPANLEDTLLRHLGDAAHAPREAAAMLLAKHFDVEAIEIWRAQLRQSPSSMTYTALCAMRDRATHDDIERVAPLLRHPRARCRIAALEALVRMSAPALPDYLADALGDPHRRVVRCAVRGYARSGLRPSPQRLIAAYAAARDERVRRALVCAAQLADRWEALELLLTWITQCGAGCVRHLGQQLDRWARTTPVNDRPLDALTGARLYSLLETARARHPAHAFTSAADALDNATPPSATP